MLFPRTNGRQKASQARCLRGTSALLKPGLLQERHWYVDLGHSFALGSSKQAMAIQRQSRTTRLGECGTET